MARSFAGLLVADGFRVDPDPPHTNTFLVFAEGDADEVNGRLASFMERTLAQPSGPWQAAEVPGWVVTEMAAQGGSLEHDPSDVAGGWREVVHG